MNVCEKCRRVSLNLLNMESFTRILAVHLYASKERSSQAANASSTTTLRILWIWKRNTTWPFNYYQLAYSNAKRSLTVAAQPFLLVLRECE